jgi:hypothetical protein
MFERCCLSWLATSNLVLLCHVDLWAVLGKLWSAGRQMLASETFLRQALHMVWRILAWVLAWSNHGCMAVPVFLKQINAGNA